MRLLTPNGEVVAGRPPQPITGQTVEGVRKVLNRLYGDAYRASRGPGGNQTDLRAMQAIVDAFTQHVDNVEEGGGFSGDVDALRQARDAARAAHADYRSKFFSQGPRDRVPPLWQQVKDESFVDAAGQGMDAMTNKKQEADASQ